jgi:hypothetical protein
MVTARVDLAGLQQELKGFANSVDSWAAHSVAAAEAAKEEHLTRLRGFQSARRAPRPPARAAAVASQQPPCAHAPPPRPAAAIRDLHQQQLDLERRADAVQQRERAAPPRRRSPTRRRRRRSLTPSPSSNPHAGLVAEDCEVEELAGELAAVRAEQAALPARVAEVEGALGAEAAAAAARRGALGAAEGAKARKLADLRAALALYRDRLGLLFERRPDETLDCVFTRVAPADPERAFTVSVKVLEGDRYAATAEPPLPALPALVAALNASGNNFAAFVRGARREFAALAAREAGAA